MRSLIATWFISLSNKVSDLSNYLYDIRLCLMKVETARQACIMHHYMQNGLLLVDFRPFDL